MAGPHRSRGFTLVELLVVITIIGMLVSLLLPAVQSAREAGRRNTCMSNMRQCGMAFNMIENSKRSYPGFVNNLNNKRASWAVMILPYIEQNPLYRLWQTNPGSPSSISTGYTTNGTQIYDSTGTFKWINPWAYTPVSIFTCPSKPNIDSTNNPLSFMVNCGSAKTNLDNYPVGSNIWPEDPNSGVFFNHFNGTSGSFADTPGKQPVKKITMDFLNTNDGSAYTVTMSENLNNSTWATNPLDTTNVYPWSNDFQVKQQMGMVWFVNGNLNNDDNTGLYGINTQLNPLTGQVANTTLNLVTSGMIPLS